MRIVLTGGGTGGHLTPLLAVADALRRAHRERSLSIPLSRNGNLEVLYAGVVTDVDQAFLDSADVPAVHIPSGKIRRYLSGAALTTIDLLFRLPFGILRALWRIYLLMPEAVFSKGGYGSVPVVIAAWIYRIPVLLHETDVVPGLANRRLARFASAIAVAFRASEKEFPPAKAFVAGTPLRTAFLASLSRAEARTRLKLHDRKPVLVVTGGSQGAQRINRVILELLTRLLPEYQIIHQVGAVHFPAIRQLIETTFRTFPDIGDYHAFDFLSPDDLAAAYASADLVICRAGGTTLAELAAIGCPAILIPLREAANNHQWENAYLYREAGAALVLDETNLAPPIVESAIRKLFQDPAQRELMRTRMHALHRPSAADDLAQLLVAMGAGYAPRRLLARTSPEAQPTS